MHPHSTTPIPSTWTVYTYTCAFCGCLFQGRHTDRVCCSRACNGKLKSQRFGTLDPEAARERLLAQKRAQYQAHKAEILAAQKLYREAHHEELLAKQRACWEATKPQRHAGQREYRETHKAEIAERDRLYREANKARHAAYHREYHAAHREEIAARRKRWYEANKDVAVAIDKAWVETHREQKREILNRGRAKRRGLLAGSRCDLTVSEWTAIKEAQGHRCTMCGEVKTLTRDHIIPLSRGGDHTASNIQGLCRSCNSKKSNRPLSLPEA